MIMSGATRENAIMEKQPATTANVSQASQPMRYFLKVMNPLNTGLKPDNGLKRSSV